MGIDVCGAGVKINVVRMVVNLGVFNLGLECERWLRNF